MLGVMGDLVESASKHRDETMEERKEESCDESPINFTSCSR